MVRAVQRTREGAVRQCALTRARRPVNDLLRFVVDPDGCVVPDLKRRLPGRGVWLTAAVDVVTAAVEKGIFARALRQTARADATLPATVEALLAKSALGSLSLANKAGDIVVGFDAVDRAIAAGRAAGLVHASDAAANGRRKLDRRFLRQRPDAEPESTIVCGFSGAELSLAIGRPNVVHAALMEGGAGGNFVAAVRRLERFRAGSAAFETA